ncbi:type IV pilin protein [Saccharospirillum alexandrii]|uniref:type IV pilin protein n=1 Tax=Saccharospirillum alexandrii TaxID=2448477 RepID=UPI0037358DD4
MKNQRQCSGGFSLIEIMIVVAIVAIIAVIAVPSYTSYVERSRCTDAQADLMELAQWMERRYAANFNYLDLTEDPPAVPDLPFTQSPDDASAAFDITLEATATTFTLTATPIAGRIRADGGACGTLTLDNQGNEGDWI